MAVAGIELTAEIAELRELQQAIGKLFTNSEKTAIIKAALTKAIEPAYQALKRTAPLGPTGNLQRAVAKKIQGYSKDGNAVALIGFKRAALAGSESAAGGTVRAGPDRAFHQWWLENGTQERYTKTAVPAKPYKRGASIRGAFQRREYTMTRNGKTITVRAHAISGHSVSAHDVENVSGQFYYASSFRRLGPFKIIKDPSRPGRVGTDPAYPNAFFMRSRNPIRIPPMPRGGTSGEPPLQTAWDRTRATVAEILQQELRISLERALETLSTRTGTIGE